MLSSTDTACTACTACKVKKAKYCFLLYFDTLHKQHWSDIIHGVEPVRFHYSSRASNDQNSSFPLYANLIALIYCHSINRYIGVFKHVIDSFSVQHISISPVKPRGNTCTDIVERDHGNISVRGDVSVVGPFPLRFGTGKLLQALKSRSICAVVARLPNTHCATGTR